MVKLTSSMMNLSNTIPPRLTWPLARYRSVCLTTRLWLEEGLHRGRAEQEAILKQYHVLHLMFRVDSSENLESFKDRLLKSREVLARYVT